MLNYFMLHLDAQETVDELSDAEAGQTLKALLAYCNSGQEPELTGGAKIVFGILRRQFDRDKEAYEAKCARLSANGAKGGRPAKAKETYEKQMVSEETNGNQTEANETYEKPNININRNTNTNINTNRKRNTNITACAERFALFWSEYPRHEAKQVALKAFEKINPDDGLLETMIASIRRFKESSQWNEDGGKYIPHPATWLNQHRWEDEPPKDQGYKPKKAVTENQYDQRPNDEPDGSEIPAWLQERMITKIV